MGKGATMTTDPDPDEIRRLRHYYDTYDTHDTSAELAEAIENGTAVWEEGNREPVADWIEFKIRMPSGKAQVLFKALRRMGFSEIDWCVQERKADLSRVYYYPAPPHEKRYWDDYEPPVREDTDD